MDLKEKDPKKVVRHLKVFAGGKMTPNEFHRAIGIRKKCQYCGNPAAVRIRVLITLADLTERILREDGSITNPEILSQIMEPTPDGTGWQIPTVPTIYGPMVKVSDVGACKSCQSAAEKTAAHGPSWCLVEIDRGPNPNERVVVGAH